MLKLIVMILLGLLWEYIVMDSGSIIEKVKILMDVDISWKVRFLGMV